ncbi:macrophage migration inhibitory factor-like protein 1 [Dermatophagoides farinae]|uniref:L-dopachrome isomerase n=1 Tax=Dermatophagoides farinae TaxID=6954 RepID=A0A9D4P9P7_DERFA|nr:macrophage migration inhibitory factor-like protein 1 [Dermatophagoides farinae]
MNKNQPLTSVNLSEKEWTVKEKLALLSGVKKYGPKILKNPELAVRLRDFGKDRPYDWFNTENCIEMYEKTFKELRSDDIDKCIEELEQKRLKELRISMKTQRNNQAKRNCQNKNNESCTNKTDATNIDPIAPEFENNKLTTTIVPVVSEIQNRNEKPIEVESKLQIDNVLDMEQNENQSSLSNVDVNVDEKIDSNDDKKNDSDQERIMMESDEKERIQSVDVENLESTEDQKMLSNEDEKIDSNEDEMIESVEDENIESIESQQIQSGDKEILPNEDEKIQSVEVENLEPVDEMDEQQISSTNIESDDVELEAINTEANDDADIQHTTDSPVEKAMLEDDDDDNIKSTETIIAEKIEKVSDVAKLNDDITSLVVRKESITYSNRHKNVKLERNVQQSSESTRRITRSISRCRRSIQMEDLDLKTEISQNVSKTVNIIDQNNSSTSNDKSTTVIEKQINQQPVKSHGDDDDDDNKQQQPKEILKDSKLEISNVSESVSFEDQNNSSTSNDKPTTVIEKQTKQQPSKSHDDNDNNNKQQQPKGISKESKKEKSQSKDVEEFNIITRSASKKIAEKAKSPSVGSIIQTRSNDQSKCLTIEQKTKEKSPTTTTTTTTPVLVTKKLDIIMAKKLTSIVKSIEKHDYFDYIQRSHSSLSSLVKDAIKKPINMENIMNRINDGQIDSEIKLKNEILSLVLNYQILQNPDDSISVLPNQLITFGGTNEPCALVSLQSIGNISADENRESCRRIFDHLQNELNISSKRVFINYIDLAAYNVAWNGRIYEDIFADNNPSMDENDDKQVEQPNDDDGGDQSELKTDEPMAETTAESEEMANEE